MAVQVVSSICHQRGCQDPSKKELRDIGNLRQRRNMIVAGETWLEQRSHAPETYGATSGDVFVRELVGLSV